MVAKYKQIIKHDWFNKNFNRLCQRYQDVHNCVCTESCMLLKKQHRSQQCVVGQETKLYTAVQFHKLEFVQLKAECQNPMHDTCTMKKDVCACVCVCVCVCVCACVCVCVLEEHSTLGYNYMHKIVHIATFMTEHSYRSGYFANLLDGPKKCRTQIYTLWYK